MKNYLVDTHIFLWWLNDDKKLKDSIRKVIKNPKNHIYVSIISGWEISVKNRAGKLPLKATLKECFEKAAFEILNINLEHLFLLDKLPSHHKDPFDRMLVAQAKSEKLVILTDDEMIKKYNVKVLSS